MPSLPGQSDTPPDPPPHQEEDTPEPRQPEDDSLVLVGDQILPSTRGDDHPRATAPPREAPTPSPQRLEKPTDQDLLAIRARYEAGQALPERRVLNKTGDTPKGEQRGLGKTIPPENRGG